MLKSKNSLLSGPPRLAICKPEECFKTRGLPSKQVLPIKSIHMYIWFWLSITDINSVIMDYSFTVGVRECNPVGTLKDVLMGKSHFLP